MAMAQTPNDGAPKMNAAPLSPVAAIVKISHVVYSLGDFVAIMTTV